MEKKINRTLIISAHYDDTAWCWTGLTSLLAKHGQVDEATLTDTDYAGIGLVRKREQLKMMGVLGMGLLYTIGESQGFKDGHLDEVPISHIVRAIIDLLSTSKKGGHPYERIISFGDDGYTGHPDHIRLAKTVKKVFESKNDYGVRELWQVAMSPEERELWPKDYFVPIPKISLNGYIPINIEKVFDKKKEAIAAHQTQFEIPGGGGRAHIKRLSQLPKVEWFKVYRRK